MGNIAFIVDSTASFTKEWYKENRIRVAQLALKFPGEDPVLEFGISPSEFYARLKSSKDVPTTIAATPEEIMKAYDSALGSGAGHAIFLTLMKEKSTTHNTAQMIANEPPYKGKVSVIDTHTVGPAAGFIALEAKRFAESHSLEDTVAHVEALTQDSRVYLVPETLEFLKRGGRLNSVEYLFGTMLRIIPLISIQKGENDGAYELLALSKLRTMANAVNVMLEQVTEDAKAARGRGLNAAYAMVIHGDNEKLASSVAEATAQRLRSAGLEAKLHPSESCPLGFITPVVGTHVGPGAVGVSILYRS